MDRYSWHHKIYRNKAVQITKKIHHRGKYKHFTIFVYIIKYLLGCVCVWGGGGGGGGRRSHQSGSHLDAHLASTSFSASIF